MKFDSRMRALGFALGLGVFAIGAKQAEAGPIEIFITEVSAGVEHEAFEVQGEVLGQRPDIMLGEREVTIRLGNDFSPKGPASVSASTEFGNASGSSQFGIYSGHATNTKVPDNARSLSTRARMGSTDTFTVRSTTGETGLVTVKASLRVSGRVQVQDGVDPIPDNLFIGAFPGFSYGFLVDTPISAPDLGPNSLNQFSSRQFVDGSFVTDFGHGDCGPDIDNTVFCEKSDTHVLTQTGEFSELLDVEFVFEIDEMFALRNFVTLDASPTAGAMIEAEVIFGGLEVGPGFEIVSLSDELEKRDGVYNYGPAFEALVEDGPTPVAVPEPMTWAMFGFGLAGLAFVRRRRSH